MIWYHLAFVAISLAMFGAIADHVWWVEELIGDSSYLTG